MPIKNINTLQNYEDLKYTTEIARQLNNDNNGDNNIIVVGGANLNLTKDLIDNNIDEFIPKLNGMMSIGSLIDNINYSLTIDQDSKSNDFLLEFERFCNHYPELASNLLEEFNNINVDEAIKRVEKKINGNIKIDEDGYVEFPWQASIWINKVINYRLFDMNNIYEKTKNVGIKGKN